MKLFSCLLTLLLCCCIAVHAANPNKALRKELRQLTRQERALKKLNRRSSRTTAHALKQLKHNEAKIKLRQPAQAAPLLPAVVEASSRVSTTHERDTLHLTRRQKLERKIRLKKQRIATLTLQARKNEQTLTAIQLHKLHLFNTADLGDPRSLKAYTSMDKQIFYLKRGFLSQKSALMEKFELGETQKLLSQSKAQQAQLNALVQEKGTDALPARYQQQAQVKASLPQNRPGVSHDTKARRDEQMQQSINRFEQAKLHAPDLSVLKDTLTFVPDPYKGLPLRQRIRPGFNWQLIQAQGYFPATIDLAASLDYHLSKRITPMAGCSYRLGTGNGWDHLLLSDQGFSLRTGAAYLFYRQLSVFTNYEHTWLRNLPSTESRERYLPLPGIVTGLSLQAKIRLMIGYDLLAFAYPQKPSPFIFRIGF